MLEPWRFIVDRKRVHKTLSSSSLTRNYDIPALTCPENSVYNPAIVGCPRTCTDPEGKSKCDTVPQEGCECADGYVLSGEKCVLEDECGCFYNDQYFPVRILIIKNILQIISVYSEYTDGEIDIDLCSLTPMGL